MTLRLAPALAAVALAVAAPAAGAAPPWEATPFSAAPRALLAAADALTPPPGDADVDLLLEEETYRYDASGAVTATRRIVFRPLTSEGVRSWSRLEHVWAPWAQARPEVRARVVSPSGEVSELDPASLSERPLAEGGFGSQRRMLGAALREVTVGSVVEEVAVTRDLGPPPATGASIRALLAQAQPARTLRIEVEAPETLPLRWQVRGVDAPVKQSTRGGLRRLSLERRDVPAAVPPEPAAPRELPPIPDLVIGPGRSWQEVAARYAALVEARLAGADLAGPARAALGEGRPDRDRAVRAVTAWVRAELRAGAEDLGEAPPGPAPVAETLARRGGSSEDLAVLAVGLLRTAGLEAHVALLRTAWDELAPEVPGLTQLDRAVVRVEGEPALWLDPSEPEVPPGRLAPAEEGRLALVAAPGTTGLVRTPESPPEANQVRSVRELKLAESGPGTLVETRTFTGALAAAERAYRTRTPDGGEDPVERYAREVLRAEQVIASSVRGEDDPSAPLEVRIEVGESDLVRTEDEGAELPVTPDQIFSALPPLLGAAPSAGRAVPARRSDVYLAIPYRWEVVYRIALPEGFRAAPLPAGGSERFGPARLESEYAELPGGVITATHRFDTGGRRLAAADADRLGRRVRELVSGGGPVVRLERISAALIAQGRVAEGLAELHRLAGLHPREALHHLQLALTLVRLGFADAAAAEARRAVALEPERAWCRRVLGFVLEHDALGRFHGPGFDRAAALAAYRTAKRLDPDDAGGRAALAELLAHAPDGVRYGRGADLAGALAEYRAIRLDLDERDYTLGELGVLEAAGRDAEAEALARQAPGAGPERDAILLAAVAAQRGRGAAEEEARPLGEGGPEALRAASILLLRARRYEPASALAAAAAASAPEAHAEDLRRHASALEVLRRSEDLAPPRDAGEALVRRALAAAIRAPDPARALRPFLARGAPDPSLRTAMEAGLAPLAAAGRAFRGQGFSDEVRLDLVLSGLTVREEPAGGVIRLQLDFASAGGRAGPVVFAVREGGELRIAATDASWPLLGWLALRRVEAGDVAGARRWLDWAAGVVPGKRDDPWSVAGLLSTLAPAGADGPALRVAAAALAAHADPKGRTVSMLAAARGRSQEPASRRALGDALARAYLSADRYPEALAMGEELAAADPDAREPFGLRLFALGKLGRGAELERVGRERLERSPEDPELTELVASAALGMGDLAVARRAYRRIVDAGKAGPGVLNNAAWLELFFDPPAPEAVDWARAAAAGERIPQHPTLNTLAAVLAAAGRPAEAREAFARSLEAEGSVPPAPADWFALGRIAEALGLPDLARAAYARVTPEPEDPTAPQLLAARRAAALGPAPAAPPPGPRTVPSDTPPPARPAPSPPPGRKKPDSGPGTARVPA